jgi:hypothetical protein
MERAISRLPVERGDKIEAFVYAMEIPSVEVSDFGKGKGQRERTAFSRTTVCCRDASGWGGSCRRRAGVVSALSLPQRHLASIPHNRGSRASSSDRPAQWGKEPCREAYSVSDIYHT